MRYIIDGKEEEEYQVVYHMEKKDKEDKEIKGCTTPEWDLPKAEYFPIVLTVDIAVRWRYERSIASCCAPPPFRRTG